MPDIRILIIYKRSPLLDAGTTAAASSERFRLNHARHYATLHHIQKTLKRLGLGFHQHLRGNTARTSDYRLLITVGGDGTFLEAARRASPEQLILGVNSDPTWSVGQFCACDITSFDGLLDKTLHRPVFSKLHKLTITFPGTTAKPQECLNDVLVCHANPAAMSRYLLKAGKREEFQRSSGVWVASAAGATGAIASAGGKPLPLESRAFQFKPRELYRGPLSGGYRMTGSVLHPPAALEITSRMPHGRVFCDGAHMKYPLPFGKTVRISSSPSFVRMIRE